MAKTPQGNKEARWKRLLSYAMGLADGKGDTFVSMTPFFYPKPIRESLLAIEAGGRSAFDELLPQLEQDYEDWWSGRFEYRSETTDYMETVTEGGPRE